MTFTVKKTDAHVNKAIDSMADRVLVLEMQVAALLEHFERQQKQPLEFVAVAAQPEKVKVQRRAD